MRNHRLSCFYTDKIRPYLPDSEVRKLAHKQYRKWVLERSTREDQEEVSLHGIHVFVGLPHAQSNGAVRGALRHELKEKAERKPKELALYDLWQKVKAETTERFAREGNAQFIREVTKVEKSRKKRSIAARAKNRSNKAKLISAVE